MYSDQGYLTHTLPVRPLTTLHVKLFVSMIWMLLSFVLLFLSVIGLLTGMSNGEIWQEITSESWQEIAAIYGMTPGSLGHLHDRGTVFIVHVLSAVDLRKSIHRTVI